MLWVGSRDTVDELLSLICYSSDNDVMMLSLFYDGILYCTIFVCYFFFFYSLLGCYHVFLKNKHMQLFLLLTQHVLLCCVCVRYVIADVLSAVAASGSE